MNFLEHLETRKKEVRAIIDLATKEDAALDVLIALQKRTPAAESYDPPEDWALPPLKESNDEDQPIFYKEEATEFIKGISGNFKIIDFKTFLLKKYDEGKINDQSMRGPLAKLAKDGKIFIVRKGIGKAPVIYSTIDPKTSTVDSDDGLDMPNFR
jgi:hypothetical protein